MKHDSFLSRRTFVQGLSAGGAITALGLRPEPVWALTSAGQPTVLTGSDFDLTIDTALMNFTGRPRTAMTVNGTVPAPLLRWREGDTVTLRVLNRLRGEPTSIHWHGIVLPANMDGVPGLSFSGIAPGETYTYQFKVKQAGTYWYHSHSGFQEQKGLYGPLVIDPREPEPFRYDRDYVVMLSDWTDTSGEQILSKLKKQADYYNFHQRTIGDFARDVRKQGWDAAVADRRMWGEMRMTPTDLADVSGYTYTYLLNGKAPAGNWTGIFQPGERVRLRFINGSAMTYFDVRIPGLKMTVVASDGLNVRPVTVDEFRIAVAETFDVVVEPSGQDAFTIFAQSMDRSGYARGTLAVREGLSAPVPEPDPRALLTMADMGHGAHSSSHAQSASDPHSGHGAAASMAAGAPAQTAVDEHSAHSDTAHAAGPVARDKSSSASKLHSAGGDGNRQREDAGGSTSHAGASQDSSNPHAGHSAEVNSQPQTHPQTEKGNPLVDMQASSTSPRLDDPGVGLRDNGRRVLTYSDLRSPFPDPDGREPTRTIELHLTGHMELFTWSFNGVKFSDAEPLRLKYGERVRIVLVNDTMMTHPIHLHGMWSDLEDEHGRFLVRKHTIDMPPGTRRSYRVTADALGRWAYHCHLLYHMETGMFREVRVEE